MAHLKLFVLGQPRLERDGRPLELNLRKALALLVYLMVFDDRVPFGRSATWNRGFSRFYPPEGSTPCLLLPVLMVKFL